MAAGLRPEPAGDGRCGRRARLPHGAAGCRQRLARNRLERRHHRGVRGRLGSALPAADALTNDGGMPPRELEDLPFAPFLEPWDGVIARDARYDTVHLDGAELEAPVGIGAKFIESALT